MGPKKSQRRRYNDEDREQGGAGERSEDDTLKMEERVMRQKSQVTFTIWKR